MLDELGRSLIDGVDRSLPVDVPGERGGDPSTAQRSGGFWFVPGRHDAGERGEPNPGLRGQEQGEVLVECIGAADGRGVGRHLGQASGLVLFPVVNVDQPRDVGEAGSACPLLIARSSLVEVHGPRLAVRMRQLLRSAASAATDVPEDRHHGNHAHFEQFGVEHGQAELACRPQAPRLALVVERPIRQSRNKRWSGSSSFGSADRRISGGGWPAGNTATAPVPIRWSAVGPVRCEDR